MDRKVRYILMARSLSLRSISILFLLISLSYSSLAFTIEDFEDVSDWSCEEDCITFSIDNTHVQEGSFAGLSVMTDSEGTTSMCKSFDVTDLTGISDMKFYYYLDTADFTFPLVQIIGYESNAECGLLEQDTPSDETLDFVSFSQNSFNSIASCDTLDELCLNANPTGATSANIWFDILTCTDCTFTSVCTAPASGNWNIDNGDVCTLNVADSITGNLNISDGSLEIQGSGVLTVSGGFVYIYPGSNLTILSGGQING